MAKKKEEVSVPVVEAPDIVVVENLVGMLQDALAEFNDILDELLEFENVNFDIFDADDNCVNRPKRIDIMKTWSSE